MKGAYHSIAPGVCLGEYTRIFGVSGAALPVFQSSVILGGKFSGRFHAGGTYRANSEEAPGAYGPG